MAYSLTNLKVTSEDNTLYFCKHVNQFNLFCLNNYMKNNKWAQNLPQLIKINKLNNYFILFYTYYILLYTQFCIVWIFQC